MVLIGMRVYMLISHQATQLFFFGIPLLDSNLSRAVLPASSSLCARLGFSSSGIEFAQA